MLENIILIVLIIFVLISGIIVLLDKDAFK
jgi:hypothetical protein